MPHGEELLTFAAGIFTVQEECVESKIYGVFSGESATIREKIHCIKLRRHKRKYLYRKF
jgi:hypothetical protein